jgi:hypothetical protein
MLACVYWENWETGCEDRPTFTVLRHLPHRQWVVDWQAVMGGLLQVCTNLTILYIMCSLYTLTVSLWSPRSCCPWWLREGEEYTQWDFSAGLSLAFMYFVCYAIIT